MEPIIEWRSPEHNFDKKSKDWYWIFAIICLGISVLSFYFGNFLFGIFVIIACITISILSYKETGITNISITMKGIIFGRQLYPWQMYRSFWIEDEHIHGPRILMRPMRQYMPLVIVPISDELDLNDVRDVLLEFLEEEFLEESIFHKWFDSLIAKW